MRRLCAVLLAGFLFKAAGARAAEDAESEPFTPAEYAAAVRATVDGRTVHERLGPGRTPLPLELSNFLLDHPDFSAEVVRRRGIAPYRIEMLGPRRSRADDGEGTSGVVNLLSRTDRRRLYYGEGVHHSRLFPDVRASAVIVMELAEETAPDGRRVTVTVFDVYVRMRSRFVAGVVKTLRPFLQRTVVGKFSKAFMVADEIGRLTARDPGALAEDARSSPALFAEERDALLALTSRLPPPSSTAR